MALALFTPDVVIATNETGRDLKGQLDHWVSMHPDKLGRWLEERRKAGRHDPVLWRPRHKQPPYKLPMRDVASWGGSSGLMMVTLAVIVLEVDRAVLAGVPIEVEGAHYFSNKPWAEAPRYRAAWLRYLPRMRNRVKSASGWTRTLLGEPTPEWFDAVAA
jgi:hypothetical protein